MSQKNILETTQKPRTVILFTVLTFGFFLLSFIFSKISLSEGKNFDDDRNKIYAIVHIDITSLPIAFETVAKGGIDTFYITGTGENLYIVKLDKKQYQQIQEKYENNPTDFIYHIVGRTYQIFPNLKNSSQSTYNDAMGETIIKSSNHEKYFGQAYIDGTEKPSLIVDGVFFTLGCVCVVAVLFSIIEYVRAIRELKQAINIHGKEKLTELLNDPQTLAYQNAGTYLTKQYLISNSVDFKVISYDDIFWMYILNNRLNFISIGKNIMVATMDGKCQPVVWSRDQKVLEEIISKIYEKNPAIRLGYSKDNQQSYRNYFNQNR